MLHHSGELLNFFVFRFTYAYAALVCGSIDCQPSLRTCPYYQFWHDRFAFIRQAEDT